MFIKNYSWNPSTCICGNSKHLKRISDNLWNACDEIVYVMHIVSTNMTKTISTNASTSSDVKNVRYKTNCYIFRTVLLMIILLFIIVIFCCNNGKTEKRLTVLSI